MKEWCLAKPVKLASIDLNLLVVFDAIMRERSVTRAGAGLGLSQPAMSHALTRLRHVLKDDLFVRSPTGMMPTPRADSIAAPVRAALDSLQQSLEPVQFDAALATRTFRIAVDNYSALVLVAAIAGRIAGLAPQVRLDFRPGGTLDILELLDRRELDLAIGPFGAPGERFSLKPLLRDQFVLVHRRKHPAIKGQPFPTERLSGLKLLEISSARFGAEFVESNSETPTPKLKPAMRAPFLSAAPILAGSDLVAVLPTQIARAMTQSHPLAMHPLSRPPKPIHSAMIWPRWLDDQPAHLWLRGIVGEAASQV